MNKKKIFVLSALFLLCGCSVNNSSLPTSSSSTTPPTSEVVSDDYFKLNEDKTGFIMVKCPAESTLIYDVPETYKGLPVVGIKNTAFENKTFQILMIPSTVTYLEKGVLYPLSGSLTKLITPFVGENINDSSAYIGMMFGIKDVTGKNMTSFYASKFASLTITNQEILPDGLLNGCDTLESVTIQNCKEIGIGALKDMKALTSLTLPDGLEKIGVGAISGDTNLKSLTIPDTVNYIDYQAFYGLPFEEFTLPKSLKTFNYLQGMPNLKKWIISSECTDFLADDGVLYSKDYSKLVNFPAQKDATGFVINKATKEICTHAFEKTNITSLDFSNIERIDSYAFYGNKYMEKLTFGSKLEFIGTGAFSYATKLNEIVFADNLVEGKTFTVENLTFAGCINLVNITLPKYYTTIESSTFASCKKLENVTIKGEIKNLGLLAFARTSIKELSITFADDAYIGSKPFEETNINKLKLHFVSGIKTYPVIQSTGLGATPRIEVDTEEIATSLKARWSNAMSTANLITLESVQSTEFTIKDGVLSRYDASQSLDPTRIIISDNVTSIGEDVFKNLTDVQYVYIPSSVTEIAVDAFKNCPNILEIEFGHDDPSILVKDAYFYRCIGLNNDTKTVLAIKDMSKEAKIRAGFKLYNNVIIKDRADLILNKERCELYNSDKTILYANNSKDTAYKFIDSVKKVGYRAFYNNATIESIDWNNVEEIDTSAFSRCKKISELHFTDKIKSIGIEAFSYSGCLKTITFTGATAIGTSAFYGDEENDVGTAYSVTTLDLGKKITSIGDGAFSYILGSVEVVIPASCTDVGTGAFDYFSDQEDASIYFEGNIATYSAIDEYWVDDFVSCAREFNEVVVAFYSETTPSEDELTKDYKYWHYDENNNKVLY